MAQAGDDQREALDLAEDLPPLGRREDREHHLGHVERVPPVVVRDVAVVLLHRQQPPAQHLVVDVEPLDQVQI